MTSLIQTLRMWGSAHPYSSLKKDDDLGVDKLKKLIETYPLEPKMYEWHTESVKQYTAQLIEKVQNVPVTSSNVDTLKDFLEKIASLSYRCKNSLIQELEKAKNIDPGLRKTIIGHITMAYSAHS
jgi:hypothetical protein